MLAAGVRLLDIGCFRVGCEEYAEEHETFGIATLRNEHVSLRGAELVFEYPAKGSITRTLTVNDPAVRDAVRSLRRRRAQDDDLLAWKEKNVWINVRAADLNGYIKDEAGEQFSAKDFRTWSATVYASVVLARDATSIRSGRSRQRAVTAAVKEVAEYLGNTPEVCRSSYIDPRVIDRFDAGDTIAAVLARIGDDADRPELERSVEDAVIELLGDGTEAAA